MKKFLFTAPLFIGLMLGLMLSAGVFAVEAAPRISDREIVERLTRLEEGQEAMRERFEQRFSSMEEKLEQRLALFEQRLALFEQRLSAMEEKFEQRLVLFDQRLSAMEGKFEQRFSSLEKRMDDRMDAQWNLTLVLIGAIFGLIGFVVWDRKTALKPLERRFERIAKDLEYELDLESPQGSRLSRLFDALRELALKDPPLADVLERFALLEGLPKKA